MIPILHPLFSDLLLGSTSCLCKGHWSAIVQCPRNIISFILKKDIVVRGQNMNFNCPPTPYPIATTGTWLLIVFICFYFATLFSFNLILSYLRAFCNVNFV